MRWECRERFPPPPNSKETASWRSWHASRHVRHARAVMHVGIAYPRWRGKRSRHSRRMRTRNLTYLARDPCNSQWVHSVCEYLCSVGDKAQVASAMLLSSLDGISWARMAPNPTGLASTHSFVFTRRSVMKYELMQRFGIVHLTWLNESSCFFCHFHVTFNLVNLQNGPMIVTKSLMNLLE